MWSVTVAIILAMFLALQNPYWIPGGDSEVYLAIARNIAAGNGYMFNGQPARIAPPGWPMLLAAAIRHVSPEFLVLKLLAMGSMLGALAISYWILRRYVLPVTASAIIVLTALLSHVYPLTFWLHSDALFSLITAAMLLVAVQISERSPNTPISALKVVLLIILCVACAFVRWAGLINIVIVCAALMQHGQWRGRRGWLLCAVVFVAIFGTYRATSWGINYFAPNRVAFEESAQIDLSAVTSDIQLTEAGVETKEPSLITGTQGASGYGTRLVGYGTWFSYLLWQPFRLAAGIEPIWWTATAVGWVVIVVICFALLPELRAGRWLLPGVMFYTFALCLNWPHATARYLVPIAPLILLLIVMGLRQMRDLTRAPGSRWRPLVTTLAAVGIGAIVLCNVALYSIDLWVMRSKDFYDRYEAGQYKPLIAAAQWLNDHQIGHWQACVNPKYININKRRLSPTGLRILTMLTSKAMLQLPRSWSLGPYKLPNDRDFRRNFIAKNQVRYYLEQPKTSPWRLQHFRMPWLQQKLTGEPPEPNPAGDGWQLYVCDGASSPVQVKLDLENIKYPTRVPGF